MSLSSRRAQEYRRLAERLHDLSERAAFPEAKAELQWLAKSYERLARKSAEGALMDGHLTHRRPINESYSRAIAD
jgi:hypothetical protein